MLSFPIKFPRRRRPQSRRAASSATPPVALVHVLFVKPAPGESTVATWVFDADIEDPTETLDGLTINGVGGISWERDDPAGLRIDHGIVISAGQTWSSAAGAGGIVGTDGQSLAAGSGVVVND